MMSVSLRPPARRYWLLAATLILLVAAAFRLVLLRDVPPGLAQDEVLDADIAAFIRAGERALFFSHGYGHEPLYHYLAAPFQPLFGDNYLAIRLPSVYLGLLLVALTMRWAKREFSAVAALVAGAGLAISWWAIIFSRIGIRPILEPLLLVTAVWFWPLGARELTRRQLFAAALAGLFLGLSYYSYTAARVVLLIPLLMLFVLTALWRWRGRKSRGEGMPYRAQAVYALVVLTAGALVYLPLAVTLQVNPQLQQRLEQLEGPLEALREGDARPVLQMTAATLGVFSFTGDPRWTYSVPNRPLFEPATALLFYAGLVLALWRWRQPRYLLLPIWLAVALLPSALSPDAPSTVRLVGALPVVYLLPGLTVGAAAGRLREMADLSRRRWTAALLVGGMLALAGVNGYRTIRDGFIRWPVELETRLRYQSALAGIGRHWLADDDGIPPVVAEVFYEPIDRDSLRRSIGADPAARWIQTGGGVSGALVWPGGDEAMLYVPEYAPVSEALLSLGGADLLPIYRSPDSPSFALYRLPVVSPDGRLAAPVPFGGAEPFVLIGLEEPLVEGGTLEFATWWRVDARPPDDLAIFVHLLDEEGHIIAQFDGLDAAAATLQPGDIVLQRHVLPLPDDIPSSEVDVRLGLYRRGSGGRLQLLDGADTLLVGQCRSAASGLTCSLTDPH